MPCQFGMHGLDGLQGCADPHRHRLPGSLGSVAGDPGPTAETEGRGKLGNEELLLRFELLEPTQVVLARGLIDLLLQIHESAAVRATGCRVDHRAGVDPSLRPGRTPGPFDQVEDMDLLSGPAEQHGEVAHALGVHHGDGPAPEL